MSEHQLETYLCEHPQQCLGPHHIIIGRQIRVAHGIIDVLAIWTSPTGSQCVQVIELKERELKAQDIAQVLRYRLDIYTTMLDYAVNQPPPSEIPEINRAFTGSLACIAGCEPVLIGDGCSPHVLAAADSAGVAVRKWRYGPHNTLTTEAMRPEPIPATPTYPGWMHDIARRYEKACAQSYKWSQM